MPENAAELKLCPFCKNEANLVEKDGLPGWGWWRVVCGCCLIGTAEYPLKSAAIKAWNRRYEPPNSPLTLDELRGMDGEPVWTERYGWQIFHGIKSVNGILSIDAGKGVFLSVQTYGLEWLAYRRRPEEAQR